MANWSEPTNGQYSTLSSLGMPRGSLTHHLVLVVLDFWKFEIEQTVQRQKSSKRIDDALLGAGQASSVKENIKASGWSYQDAASVPSRSKDNEPQRSRCVFQGFVALLHTDVIHMYASLLHDGASEWYEVKVEKTNECERSPNVIILRKYNTKIQCLRLQNNPLIMKIFTKDWEKVG